MPDAPDRRRPEPTLIGDDSGNVGFLNAPGVDDYELVGAIRSAFDSLALGAVLTVYSDRPGGEGRFADLCGIECLDLIAAIPHPEQGITYTLQRRA